MSSFRTERLSQLASMERWHFWFQGRQVVVDRLLGRYVPANARLLDVGCGTGWQVQRLAMQGICAVGMDLHRNGIGATRRAMPEAQFLQGLSDVLPFAACSFDALLALDVLEHTNDESTLLAFHRVMRPGGIVLVTVPAIPWLWSFRDVDAGHRRRYIRKSLVTVIQRAGFQVKEVGYYQFFLFPLALLTRLLGRGRPGLRDQEDQPHPLINSLLSGINRLEGRLGAFLRWPVGTSLFLVCQKPDHDI